VSGSDRRNEARPCGGRVGSVVGFERRADLLRSSVVDRSVDRSRVGAWVHGGNGRARDAQLYLVADRGQRFDKASRRGHVDLCGGVHAQSVAAGGTSV